LLAHLVTLNVYSEVISGSSVLVLPETLYRCRYNLFRVGPSSPIASPLRAVMLRCRFLLVVPQITFHLPLDSFPLDFRRWPFRVGPPLGLVFPWDIHDFGDFCCFPSVSKPALIGNLGGHGSVVVWTVHSITLRSPYGRLDVADDCLRDFQSSTMSCNVSTLAMRYLNVCANRDGGLRWPQMSLSSSLTRSSRDW
jgi:hypothetical protein